jgi:hypothetical protein
VGPSVPDACRSSGQTRTITVTHETYAKDDDLHKRWPGRAQSQPSKLGLLGTYQNDGEE